MPHSKGSDLSTERNGSGTGRMQFGDEVGMDMDMNIYSGQIPRHPSEERIDDDD